MSELYFKIGFGVLWVLYVVIRAPHEKKYKLIEKKNTLGSSREKFLVLLQFIGMVVIPWVWILSPWLDQFNMDLPMVIRISGLSIAVFSLWFFWLVHKTLGINWSPVLEIRKEHKLIKTGPYKRIRHPMYTQIWLWSGAQMLIISNWIAGLSGIALWAILYFIRVRKEEQMMLEEFGEEYEEYMRNTGRVFPKY